MTDRPEFLTAPEVAHLLRVHPSTITRMIQRGEIATTLVGRRRVVSREAFDEYVARNTTPAAAPVARQPRAPRVVSADREQLREEYPFLRRAQAG